MNEKIRSPYLYSRIFEADSTFRFGKEPVLRRMPDGNLFCLIYTGGEKEPSDENVVAGVRSLDNGKSWSAPAVLFYSRTHAVWGTELFTEGSVPFAVIHTFHASTRYRELNAHRSFTTDCGKTWSSPESLHGIPSCMSIREGKVLSDGTWLFPVYWGEERPVAETEGRCSATQEICSWERASAGVIRSRDGGRHFTLSTSVEYEDPKSSAWEPAVTELENGHLRMFLRRDRFGALFSSDSFDYGQTWSAPKEEPIPNPGAKVSIYRVENLHVLFTNVCEPGEFHRRYLEAWVSDDLCRSWKKKIRIAEVTDPNEKTVNVTYPHGFACPAERCFYLAVDSYLFFSLLKIPFSEFRIGN